MTVHELQAFDAQPLANWWQPRQLTAQQCWHVAIGPLSLYLERTTGDGWWRISAMPMMSRYTACFNNP